ncbi:MAG: hypothetical protein ABSH50_13695 [Bryobacteraceae bacterium]|jgi:hypothetical protein
MKHAISAGPSMVAPGGVVTPAIFDIADAYNSVIHKFRYVR